MMRNESHKAEATLYALKDSASRARFVSSWQLNSKREYPAKEVDACGCACNAATKS